MHAPVFVIKPMNLYYFVRGTKDSVGGRTGSTRLAPLSRRGHPVVHFLTKGSHNVQLQATHNGRGASSKVRFITRTPVTAPARKRDAAYSSRTLRDSFLRFAVDRVMLA